MPMKRLVTAAALSLALAAQGAVAQPLQPTMSAQDVRAQMEPTRGHVMVPILAMVFVALALSGGSDAPQIFAGSDERLKTDIRPVGAAANGLTLYEFRYRGHPGVYQGVMAQEVAPRFPEAVYRRADGMLFVNYAALGLEMVRVR
jgi:hypothetical protein